MTGEPVAPRCLSVFTSLHLTANCSRRSREANSVVWEAEIIQMDGSHDPHIPPAWISLAGLVECGEADDVWDGEEGEEEGEGGEEVDHFRRTASCLLTTLFVCHNCLKSFPVNSANLVEDLKPLVEGGYLFYSRI